MHEQPELADRNVSTNRESAHQTLSERVADFRVQRSERSYSMSIESSRLRKIRKAIES
ncbi:YopJ family acetyltransferase [Pseudomonas savastanoi]